jgi:surfactin synthase thioesterase subunit
MTLLSNTALSNISWQALSMFNKDQKSRKFHKDSDKDLLNRMIELGFVPTYMKARRDLLVAYVPQFRSGEI